MSIGFSTCGCWAPLQDLKEIEIEDRGNPWFDDSNLDLEAQKLSGWSWILVMRPST